MADLKALLIEAFASNPNVKALHQTKDGQCFEKGHMAAQHAKEIGGKVTDTEEYQRADLESEIAAADKAAAEKAAEDALAAEIAAEEAAKAAEGGN